MDSALAPLLIEESARPSSAYEPFTIVERAAAQVGGQQKGLPQTQPTPDLIPSPLLSFVSSNVLLHFQYGPSRRLTSPQVPESDQLRLAVAGYATEPRIALASNLLASLGRLLAEEAPAELRPAASSKALVAKSQVAVPAFSNGDVLIQESGLAQSGEQPQSAVQQPDAQFFALNSPVQQSEQVQQMRSSAEYSQRANVYQPSKQQVTVNYLKAALDNTAAAGGAGADVQAFRAVWLGDQILLARRVERLGGLVVQGVWLNWTNLRASLLGSIKDLFPKATLSPVRISNQNGASRLLASLPARLEPGPVPSMALPAWTPVRLTLTLAWAGAALAALAIAFLLHGAVSLSERRAAFVSAVTHELRTPLTTFKMYSEMLAENMVPDVARQRQYLETLSVEANRLSHLVENVLAYARLEKGSARRREERLSLGELIERVRPRLLQRAEQAGMALVEDVEPRSRTTVVHVDVSAVEQILFNLIDNACKYAAPHATEKIIHLEALPDGKFAMLRVRDHGQGITAEGVRRLFQPFSKSALEAAHTAPGVGLGLALCRRLSRSMGGDLRLARHQMNGACFELLLPLGSALAGRS
jgi:signal transduction histidine kinase